MRKIIAVLFGVSCFTTAAVSNSMMGVGMWFWLISATGIFVAASQFVPMLRDVGAVAATILATISVCAVILTLLASTIGGSSGLGGSESLLVFSFVMIAVFGFSLARINRKSRGLSANES